MQELHRHNTGTTERSSITNAQLTDYLPNTYHDFIKYSTHATNRRQLNAMQVNVSATWSNQMMMTSNVQCQHTLSLTHKLTHSATNSVTEQTTCCLSRMSTSQPQHHQLMTASCRNLLKIYTLPFCSKVQEFLYHNDKLKENHTS